MKYFLCMSLVFVCLRWGVYQTDGSLQWYLFWASILVFWFPWNMKLNTHGLSRVKCHDMISAMEISNVYLENETLREPTEIAAGILNLIVFLVHFLPCPQFTLITVSNKRFALLLSWRPFTCKFWPVTISRMSFASPVESHPTSAWHADVTSINPKTEMCILLMVWTTKVRTLNFIWLLLWSSYEHDLKCD